MENTESHTEKPRIRYGRFTKGRRHGHRRSTLVTVRRDDYVFFGISKCREDDKWDRKEGLSLAKDQLITALSGPSIEPAGGVTLHHSKLAGICPVDDVIDLLKYFETVNEFIPR